MDVFRVSGVVMLGLTALLLLKQFRPEWGSFLRMGVMLFVVGFLLTLVIEVLDFVKEFESEGGLSDDMWQILLKSLGITLVTEIASNICKDAGEAGMAQWIETAGRLEILVISLPLIGDILSLAKQLLQIG